MASSVDEMAAEALLIHDRMVATMADSWPLVSWLIQSQAIWNSCLTMSRMALTTPRTAFMPDETTEPMVDMAFVVQPTTAFQPAETVEPMVDMTELMVDSESWNAEVTAERNRSRMPAVAE